MSGTRQGQMQSQGQGQGQMGRTGDQTGGQMGQMGGQPSGQMGQMGSQMGGQMGQMGGQMGGQSLGGMVFKGEYGIDFNLNTGDNIPAIGLGTWQIDPQQIGKILRRAIELGYRHFDCASQFGNQKEIGTVLNEYIHTKGLGRNNFFITSKLWNTNHRKEHVKQELERTLRDLQVRHLNLFLMHFPVSFEHTPEAFSKDASGKGKLDNVPLEETWRAMEVCMKDGMTRALGVANFTLEQLQKLYTFAEIKPAVAQFEVHPYLIQSDVLEFCNRHGIVVVCHTPLGSVEGCDELLNDPTLKQLATKYRKTPSQIILRWNIQNRRCVIPKCRDLGHLEDNLKIFDFEISKEDLAQIDTLHRGRRYLLPSKVIGVPIFEDEKKATTTQVGAR